MVLVDTENSIRGVPLSVLLQADQKRVPCAIMPLIFEEVRMLC